MANSSCCCRVTKQCGYGNCPQPGGCLSVSSVLSALSSSLCYVVLAPCPSVSTAVQVTANTRSAEQRPPWSVDGSSKGIRDTADPEPLASIQPKVFAVTELVDASQPRQS